MNNMTWQTCSGQKIVGNIIFSHSCVFNLGLVSAFFKNNWDRRDFGPQAGQIIDSCAYQLKGNPPISSSKNQIIKSIIKSIVIHHHSSSFIIIHHHSSSFIIIHHHSSSYLSDSIDYLSARLTPPGKTCTHLAFLGPGLGNQSDAVCRSQCSTAKLHQQLGSYGCW